MTSSDDLWPAVVIGGGLAGLTAGLHLAERDVPPLVLERATEWAGGCLSGGPMDTFEHGGRTWSFKSEHSAHALWGGYDNMRQMLEGMLGITLRESEGEEWINRWGSRVAYVEAGTMVRRAWIPAPFHYVNLLLRPRFWSTVVLWDILSLPGLITSFLLSAGFDPIMEETELPGLTIEDYFRFWTPNLRATFRGLGHSLLAAPSESISLAGFIAAIRYYTLLRRDTWRLSYLPGNSDDCLIRPMIERINANGQVLLGARVTGLRRAGDAWAVTFDDAKLGGEREVMAESVIFAAEPQSVQAILSRSPDCADLAAQIEFPRSIECAVARMWFDTQPPDYASRAPGGMFTGDFAVDNFFWLDRLHHEFAEWGRAGGCCIETHFYSPPEVFEQSDAMLLATATTEVQRAFPALRGHFAYGAIRRNGLSMTEFRVPTARSLHVETPWPGVFACGDWVGYPHPSLWMERSTVTGIASANAVLVRHGRDPWPIIPARTPEPLARWMGSLVRAGRRLFAPLVRRRRRKR